MKKTRIGIPRALLYYRYNNFWKSFFESLNCEIVISPKTNYEIFKNGKRISMDESCLSYKIYLGHIDYLKDKCDYVLIPRVADYGKNNKVCLKFNSIYDEVKILFPNLKVLNYNIEYTKYNYEFFEYIKLGYKVNKNIIKIINSYIKSKKIHKIRTKQIELSQKKVLNNKKNKVLIVSHPYIIYDEYLSKKIISFLVNNNIEIIYSDRLNKKISQKYSKSLSETLYWKYSKENIGAIKYYQDDIKGIIFLTAFPCGVDSIVNELMIRKIKNIPILNIIIDESAIEVGVETRLESFVDIIKGDIYE